MVVLVARGVINTERRAEAYEAFQAMLAPSRAEPGCISYEYFTDVDDPDRFVFVEEWESYEILQAHFETPHFVDFAARCETMLTDAPDIRIYDVRGMLGD